MKHNIFPSIAFLALLVLCVNVANATVIIDIVPSEEKIKAGEQLDVDVVISGLIDDPATSPANEDALGAFDLRMVYNPFILDFVSLTFGDPLIGDQLDVLGFGFNPQGYTPSHTAAGYVEFFEVSLDSVFDLETLQADSFTLATLSFTGLAAGSTTLNLAIPDLSDARGNVMAATVNSSSVEVPEPAILALLLIGVAGLRLTHSHDPALCGKEPIRT